MGMVIHDDFWAACQAMPEKQRAQFLYAIALYRFEKEEPKGNPPWLPTFLVIKDRIEMGDDKSERAQKAANARWEKERARKAQEEAQARDEDSAQAYADAYAQADTQAYALAQNSCNAEVEYELVVGVPPYNPPMQNDEQRMPFWLQCLNAFNDVMATTYTSMPEKCRHRLERSEGTVSVEEVRAMIAYKRDEWCGTKYRKGLTPNTLFSPDHFEQYLHQSQAEAKEAKTYAKYDNL